MRTLVICRPAEGVSGQDMSVYAADELAALRQLHADGILHEAYSPGRPGAVLIFEAERDVVDEALSRLPLRKAGLIDVEVVPLRPFDLGDR